MCGSYIMKSIIEKSSTMKMKQNFSSIECHRVPQPTENTTLEISVLFKVASP